jgi:hypothetical protein
MDILDLEVLDHLRHRHDLIIMTRMPTEKCEEVQEGFWKVSFFEILRYRYITRSFGEFFTVSAEYVGEMRILRECHTECTSHQYLLRDRANPLLTSHHMRDRHEFVIDHDCTMICWESIGFHDHLIFDLIGIELDTPTNHIVEYDYLILRHLESDRMLFSCGNTRLRLLEWEVATVSVIAWWESKFFLFGTKSRQTLGCTEAIIRTSLLAELVESWCIEIEAFTLNIWSICPLVANTLIRSESEEFMSIDDRIYGTLDETSTICVLYTDDILPLIVMCPEIAIESRTE